MTEIKYQPVKTIRYKLKINKPYLKKLGESLMYTSLIFWIIIPISLPFTVVGFILAMVGDEKPEN